MMDSYNLTGLVYPLVQETSHYNLRIANDTRTLTAYTNLILTPFILRRFGHEIACPKKQSKLHLLQTLKHKYTLMQAHYLYRKNLHVDASF